MWTWLILAALALAGVALAALIVYIVRKEGSSGGLTSEREEPASDRREDSVEPAAKPMGPPPSGAADPLENMRAAMNGMDLDDLENMLEMGGALKPGVEELIRAEIRRRSRET